ncbi:MAG: PQQ-binding-like beta-propeller repeat protein [Proteobacteria bacterium]|nr:PQQ-binding-like beta-propeller repeat protein [Pseudomonadota bacterium]
MKICVPTVLLALLTAAFTISCSDSGNGEAPEAGTMETVVAEDVTAEQPHPGEAPYQANCAACHDQVMYKAPSRFFVSMMGAQNILKAMNGGLMSKQAANISAQDRRAIAEYIAGHSLDDVVEASQPPACDSEHGFDPSVTPVSSGWGVDAKNTRFQPQRSGGLSITDVPALEVKWAFAYPNAIKARSQPGFGGGAIYFGSQDGTVRALDAKTGCLRWAFQASAEVRTAIVISPWSADDLDADPTLYFGDLLARAYAISARTGELRWMKRVDDHRDATITGTPSLVEGRLYVPVSSLEVVAALDPGYSCCTFRGSLVALDAESGEQIWKSWTIDQEPSDAGKTRAGTTILAPSGAPIWNSPAVDLERGRLYAGTGENYSSPADGNSDAIIAFDMETGAKIWVSQQTKGDAWNTGCLIEFTTDDANCPVENGPDYDFASSPMLLTLADGRNVVIGGQKSGAVMAIDPESGENLWKTQVGRGGVQGGVHFGMAVEGSRIYVPINDMFYPEDLTRYKFKTPPKPGLYALDAQTGEVLWSSPAPDVCADLQDCDPGISHAITAIPGAVIAGHMDGWLRIYSGESGELLWELNTLQDFDTVSGEQAHGGSFSGGGPSVANGMIYVNSGYGIYNHMPGNLLLAIGPKE